MSEVSTATNSDRSGSGSLVHASPLPSPKLYGTFEDQHDLPRFEAGYSARAIMSLLYRHKGATIWCVIIGTLLSTLIAFTLPRSYSAQSLVILDTRQPEVVHEATVLSNLVSGSLADPAIVRSEVALISSPAYTRNIIEHLSLLNTPEFLSEVSPDTWTSRAAAALISFGNHIGSLLGRPPSSEPANLMARAITAFGQRLTVYNDEHSYVIGLRYEAHDPAFATMIVNSLAELYISDQLATKQDAARKASGWLNDQLAVLQTKLRSDEHSIANFQQQNHLDTVLGGNVTEQRLHELNLQLVAVSDDLTRKQATLSQVQEMLASPSGAAAAAEVISSPLIQKLREQEAETAGRQAQARETLRSYPYGEARLNVIRQQIANEVHRIINGLTEDVEVARLRESLLRQRIAQQQTALDTMNRARVQLASMEREVNVHSQLYSSLLLRSQQIEADAQSLQADARVVPAETPIRPSYPNQMLFIGFGFFGSLFLGVVLAFVADRLDDTIRTAEDAERLTGVPTLGIVPRLRNGKRALAALVDTPLSVYSEAINNVLAVLRATSSEITGRVISVSSSVPSEGKTIIAAALARAASTSGIRTLLIDCDLRRASVGKLFNEANCPALTSMFNEKRVDVAQFVQKDAATGVHYLSTTETRSSPQEVLGSSWMRDLLAQVRTDYDLILLDTPPLLTASDALLLSRIVDTTLLVVRWGHTPAGLVSNSLRMLKLHSGCSIGTILSMVDHRKYMRYGRAGYYFGRFPRQHLVAEPFY